MTHLHDQLIEQLLFSLCALVVFFGGGTAIGCHYGLITSDAAGKHPLTFAQVWLLEAR